MNANFHGLAFKPNVVFCIQNDLEIEWTSGFIVSGGPVSPDKFDNIFSIINFSESLASGSSNQSSSESPLGSAIVL